MSAQQYIEHAYYTYILSGEFDKAYGNKWLPADEMDKAFRDALVDAIKKQGYFSEKSYSEITDKTVAAMEDVLFKEGDDFTGQFRLFTVDKKDAAIKALLDPNPVGTRLSTLGRSAQDRAYQEVARQEGWVSDADEAESTDGLQDVVTENATAPASDRIVSFSDNQITELDQQTSEIIEAVSTQNQVAGEPGLRELILGQLKAGREFIRAGTFRLHFLQITLIETLQFLAKRYEREAIGALAAALMTAIMQYLGLVG